MTSSFPPSRRANDPRDALIAAQREASRDVAAYIAEMTDELHAMAASAGLPVLAQFLAIARLEAQMQAGLTLTGD